MGAIQQALLGYGAVAGGGGDPDWASRLALLPLDGTNGSTVFPDVKLGSNWTAGGDAQISTAQSRYGGASLLLDGTGDFIETAHTSSWNFGSGDFFIECSIRLANVSGVKAIVSKWGSAGGDRAFIFYVNNDQLLLTCYTTGNVTATASPGFVANTWYDVACGRIGSNIYVWASGVRSSAAGITGPIQNTTNAPRIGIDTNGSTPFNGYVDDLRVSLLAGPGGNYTPSGPFPTGP